MALFDKPLHELREYRARPCRTGKKSLAAIPANEPRKVELARLVWKKTTVSQAWIAERLGMRSAANVSLALHRTKHRRKGLPAELLTFIEIQSH